MFVDGTGAGSRCYGIPTGTILVPTATVDDR